MEGHPRVNTSVGYGPGLTEMNQYEGEDKGEYAFNENGCFDEYEEILDKDKKGSPYLLRKFATVAFDCKKLGIPSFRNALAEDTVKYNQTKFNSVCEMIKARNSKYKLENFTVGLAGCGAFGGMSLSNLFRQYATCVAHRVTPVLATFNDPIGKTFCQLLKGLKHDATAGELFKAVESVTKQFRDELEKMGMDATKLNYHESQKLKRFKRLCKSQEEEFDDFESQALQAKEDLYELFELTFGLVVVSKVNGHRQQIEIPQLLKLIKTVIPNQVKQTTRFTPISIPELEAKTAQVVRDMFLETAKQQLKNYDAVKAG
eukprot:GHVO01027068.1.p1 GENE.GHVO01027068.1~~GHVO01027068.1.p1  ORF type:complete len:358 (-),score=48.14 GHVO01027068.1:28-975(-)